MTGSASGAGRGDDRHVAAWCERAWAAPYEDVVVDIPDARLTGRAWGARGAPLVLLVHGGAAHAGWWHHIGPHLAASRRVVAVDLAGHGDSSWPGDYSFERWARDLRAFVAHEGGGPDTWVVGHSMGGMVALTAAAAYGDELAGVVCVDLPDEVVRDRQVPTVDEVPPRVPRASLEEAVARFRVRPQDPACRPWVHAYVAHASVRERPDGWSWKFDPTVTTHGRFDRALLGRARCPVALVAAERGLLTSAEVDRVRAQLGDQTGLAWIEDAGHHVMLDQPEALVAAIADALDPVRPVASAERNSCV